MYFSVQEVPNLEQYQDEQMYDLNLPDLMQQVPDMTADIKPENNAFNNYLPVSQQHMSMLTNEFAYSPMNELASPSMPYSPQTFGQTSAYTPQQHAYTNSPASSTYSGSPLDSPQQPFPTAGDEYLRYGLTQAFQARHQQEYAYYYGDAYNTSKRRKRDEELTPDEYEKRRLRRERNKQAALRCRTRRRERIDALEQETVEIEQDNNKVQSEISNLQKQISEMEQLLKEHKCDKIRPNTIPSHTNLTYNEKPSL